MPPAIWNLFEEDEDDEYLEDLLQHGRDRNVVLEQVRQAQKQARPELLLQAVVLFGEHVADGDLIEAVSIPWFAIVDAIRRDPMLIHQLLRTA